MNYHQRQYSFENTNLVRISTDTMDFTINYIDLLDQTCVEFEHRHETSYEIYYCLTGVHHLKIDGTVHTLTAKDFAIIRPDILHNTVYEPNLFKQYVVFVFNEPTKKSTHSSNQQEDLFIQFLNYFSDHTHCVLQDEYDSYLILSRIQQEVDRSAPLKDLMIRQLYMEYLICILRHLSNNNAKKPEISSNTNLAIQITKYLHANYQKNISLQNIADQFYISPRHVNRIIKSYFGTTFKQMLSLYRLNYAKNYLIDTDLPIEKISYLVGFSSPKIMHQMFKTHEKMSAAKFREKYVREHSIIKAGGNLR